jgi:hypothetical protein
MNERIRLLAEQATTRVDAVPNESMAYTYFDTEKFAQLIAYECIDLALGSSHREDDMGAIIANKIKQHFGVEL